MRTKSRFRDSAALVVLLTLGSSAAYAQAPAPPVPSTGVVTTRSSEHYNRSALWRFLLGEGWRSTWIAPITVPVLDLGAYAGGLEPLRKGGNQSKTLHFRGADGRPYVFRSTDKDINDALPSDLKDTPAGDIVRDQAAAMHPTGHLAVSTMQQALGLLHAPPTLVVLPNDQRLGEFRELFANMVGQIEEKPDDEEGRIFGGAEKVVSAQTLIENLEESMEDRLDSREYLRLRFLDFIIGDPDRGGDQLEFGKYESGARDVYRPVARDRDYAFIKSDGFLMGLAAPFYPKLARFSSRHSKLVPLVFTTRDFDRSHLVDLPWAAWDSTIALVQARLTDEVIARAISQMPESHARESGARIAANLQARRNDLRTIAEQYYRMVNEDADIFASDEDERAEIERLPDGSVIVRIWREAIPVFERRFVPAETQEIRVFLERGNDHAVVRGHVDRSIQVRVIGGEGDDVLIDSSRVAHGDRTHFYDAAGNNTIVTGARTRVIRTPFVGALPKARDDDDDEEKAKPRVLQEERRGRFKDLWAEQADFVAEKTRQPHPPNYGQSKSWGPVLDYREGSGVVVGFGPTLTDYGFRRRPYESRVALRGMVGIGSGDLGLQLDARRHFEVSPWSVSLFAHATQLEANRFYGYGNDTEAVARALSLVKRDELLIRPALNYHVDEASSISVGPVMKYVRADLIANSPAAELDPLGTEPFGQLGARAELVLVRSTTGTARQSGFEVRAGGSGYPSIWDVADPFGEAHAQAELFLPLGSQTLALRAGGQRVWGTFPLHEAAFIGGSQSLRGFAWNRFAGDASAFGTAELRVPIARITLLTRGDFGLIGFTDAGRVWLNDQSEGDWHTSTGGGVWYGSLGQSASLTYAKGEEGRIYLSFGLPF